MLRADPRRQPRWPRRARLACCHSRRRRRADGRLRPRLRQRSRLEPAETLALVEQVVREKGVELASSLPADVADARPLGRRQIAERPGLIVLRFLRHRPEERPRAPPRCGRSPRAGSPPQGPRAESGLKRSARRRMSWASTCASNGTSSACARSGPPHPAPEGRAPGSESEGSRDGQRGRPAHRTTGRHAATKHRAFASARCHYCEPGMRKFLLAGAAGALIAGPTLLAFFSGGFFDRPRLSPGWSPGRSRRWSPWRRRGRCRPPPLPGRPCRAAALVRLDGHLDLWAPMGDGHWMTLQRLLLYLGFLSARSRSCAGRGSGAGSTRRWRWAPRWWSSTG